MVTIEFNGAQAKIHGELKPQVEFAVKQALTWEDKNVLTQNHINKHKSWYKEQSALRFCYNSKTKTFPTGLLKRVYVVLKSYKVEFELKRQYTALNNKNPIVPDWAYEHQVRAVLTGIKEKRGLIQSPTGSGKTNISGFILANFPEAYGLVIVPAINLLNNVHRTLEDLLQEPIGKVGNSKHDWKRVTVGIDKSLILHAEGKYKEHLEKVEILIGDEAHHYGAPEIQKVSAAACNTAIRLGLSATLNRPNGSNLVLEGMFGPRILTIGEEEMINIGVTHPPIVRYVKVPGGKKTLDVTGVAIEKVWRGVYNEGIIENNSRNDMICRIAHTFLNQPNEHGAVLILIKNKKHGIELEQRLRDMGSKCLYIDGDVKGTMRQRIIDTYRNGGAGLECIISTCILDEGEDVARLELVINGAGGPGEKQVIQRIGRGQRLNPQGPKDRCIFIDFYDEIDLIGYNKDLLLKHTVERMQHVENRYPERVKVCEEKDLVDILFK
jgi:superfamily II DNA or RNA helicase